MIKQQLCILGRAAVETCDVGPGSPAPHCQEEVSTERLNNRQYLISTYRQPSQDKILH